MIEIIIILMLYFLAIAYHLYSTLYKETKNIRVMLILFLLYNVPIIVFFIYPEIKYLYLLYLLPVNLQTYIFLNSRKKKNERIASNNKEEKCYSYNLFEYSKATVFIIGVFIIIGLLPIFIKKIDFQVIHYIVYFVNICIGVCTCATKYINIYT
ncbi:hypothetical protein [Proteiniborus sp. MB09-C3]|uniref:hypothetical protein n=1 Tax=Proteiniborus sp. MB09-C3 TaxID=3050072 RepID=UPI00255218BC|nr:hypothetical protein [Proteiniborus sp. MB09-C3]WIV10586.1 hypothetical protein QO263_10495 [Proteiniborus sp. MB09-C3]